MVSILAQVNAMDPQTGVAGDWHWLSTCSLLYVPVCVRVCVCVLVSRYFNVHAQGIANLQVRNWQFWIVTILLNLQQTDTLRHQKNHFTVFYRFLTNLLN